MEELADVREELAWEGEDPIFFYTRVLGGRWTKENKGEAADGCSGFARSGAPAAWCKKYGFPRQATFMFRKFGRQAASELAREYCRRGEHFYKVYVVSGEEAFEYEEMHVEMYKETLQWLDFVVPLDADEPAFRRALEVRELKPTLGPIATL